MRASRQGSRAIRGILACAITGLAMILGAASISAAGSPPGLSSPPGPHGHVQVDAMSADGSRVIFTTWKRLVPADQDDWYDIYERSHETTTLLSTGPLGGDRRQPALFLTASNDLSRVYFHTRERLVPADTDHADDVYLRSGGVTTLLSASGGRGNGPFDTYFAGVSADGRAVYIQTLERLAADDIDRGQDVYLRKPGGFDRVSGGEAGNAGVGAGAVLVGMSSDGTRILLSTDRSLVPADRDRGAEDLYLRAAGTTKLVTRGPTGGNGAFNALGGWMWQSDDLTRSYFTTEESMVPSDTDRWRDVYLRSGGTTTLVSTGPSGGNGRFQVYPIQAGADATMFFFGTSESLVDEDMDDAFDVYQRSGDTTTLIAGGHGFGSTFQGVSRDGTKVFVRTAEPLLPTDIDTNADIYEISGTTVTRITPATNGDRHIGGNIKAVSRDGTVVVFETRRHLDPADTDDERDIYVTAGGSTSLVSTGPINGNQPVQVRVATVSDDGTAVFFTTVEALVPGDTDDGEDIYQRSGGVTTLVSRGP